MSYAIIGFGKIGHALTNAFARKGIEVSVATTRDPKSFASDAAAIGPTMSEKRRVQSPSPGYTSMTVEPAPTRANRITSDSLDGSYIGISSTMALWSPVMTVTGRWSDLGHASIDGEIHAGDVRTFIGGEERNGSRDFLWFAPATHRDL